MKTFRIFNNVSAYLLVLCVILSCRMEDSEFVATQSVTTISASFDNGTTKVSMEESSLSLVSRWSAGDQFDIYANGEQLARNVPAGNFSEDWKSCSFGVSLPEDKYQGDIELVCATTNGNPTVIDGKLFFNASIVRMPLSNYRPPVVGRAVVKDRKKASISFMHYLTYELVHIKNVSGKEISFSLNGFSADEVWYKSKGAVAEDGSFLVDTKATEEPIFKSSTIRIPDSSSDVIVSAYIPTGYLIKDARMVAEIDGEDVTSVNSKSSQVSLQTGHAYHMYATWDGVNLKFDEEDLQATFEVTPSPLDFGKVTIGTSSTKPVFIKNTGSKTTSVYVRGSDNGAITNPELNAILAPGETIPLYFTFTPTSSTSYGSIIMVGTSKDSLWDGIDFNVIGEGVEERFYPVGDAIDLGLSVKWASFNVGATKPEEYGEYFAWGETEPKSDYSTSTYKWCNGDNHKLTKYCTNSDYWDSYSPMDNKTILDPDDDAARAKWGVSWRMPTEAEWTELMKNCKRTWTTQNGMEGYLFTGPNGNSIFLPAAGDMTGTDLDGDGASGFYWSSLLDTDHPYCANVFYFGNAGVGTTGGSYRYRGKSVRPVYDEKDDESPEIESFTVGGTVFKMVKVKGGSFLMGSAEDDPDAQGIYGDERPQHQVELDTYSIGETEVTQALWEAVMGYNNSAFKGADLPVEGLEWDECISFISELNQITGRTFRLPTEAEWEYAARGGRKSKGYRYAGSDNVDDVSWNYDNSYGQTHAVAMKKPNEIGLYDMSGNVWEWCQDWYDYSYYTISPLKNPCNTNASRYHIHRGGSAGYIIKDQRVAMRGDYTSSYGTSLRGFRLALTGSANTSSRAYVDLGLPSGTLWATCNVGATRPEEYGDYFAWGETEPYYSSLNPLTWKEDKENGYDWPSYKWCNGSRHSLTKYNTDSYYGVVDNKTTLELEDDVAHVKLGGNWRMPTWSEMEELLNNCEWTWTTINGVYGCSVTSKKDGYSDQSLFLPAAGHYSGTENNHTGYVGFYQSSNLTGIHDDVSGLYFKFEPNYFGMAITLHAHNESGRFYGCPVRPVYDDSEPGDNPWSDPSGGDPGGGGGSSGGGAEGGLD